jgi:hypothetical protein
LKNGKSEILLSKSFGDSKIIEYPLHLAETTPHKNTPLQNWDTLSQETGFKFSKVCSVVGAFIIPSYMILT